MEQHSADKASGSLSWCELKLNEVSSGIRNREVQLFQFISWMMERCTNSEHDRKLRIIMIDPMFGQTEKEKLQWSSSGESMKRSCVVNFSVVHRAASSWAVRLAACLHRESLSSLILLFFFHSGQATSRWSLAVQGQNKWPLNNTAVVVLLVVSRSLHRVAESLSLFLKVLLKVRLFHLSSSALVSLLWRSCSFLDWAL